MEAGAVGQIWSVRERADNAITALKIAASLLADAPAPIRLDAALILLSLVDSNARPRQIAQRTGLTPARVRTVLWEERQKHKSEPLFWRRDGIYGLTTRGRSSVRRMLAGSEEQAHLREHEPRLTEAIARIVRVLALGPATAGALGDVLGLTRQSVAGHLGRYLTTREGPTYLRRVDQGGPVLFELTNEGYKLARRLMEHESPGTPVARGAARRATSLGS